MDKFLAGMMFVAGLLALPFSWPVGLGLLAIGLVLLLNMWQRKSASGRDPANDPDYAPEKIIAPEQSGSQPESRPESRHENQPERQTAEAEAASASAPPERQEAAQVEDDDPLAERIRTQREYREAIQSHSNRSAILNFWKWLLIISGMVVLFVFWPVGLGLLVAAFFVAGSRWIARDKMESLMNRSLVASLSEAAENAEKNGLEPATANQVWRIGKLARETDTWDIDMRPDGIGRPLLCIERAGDIIEELQIEKLHQDEEARWG